MESSRAAWVNPNTGQTVGPGAPVVVVMWVLRLRMALPKCKKCGPAVIRGVLLQQRVV